LTCRDNSNWQHQSASVALVITALSLGSIVLGSGSALAQATAANEIQDPAAIKQQIENRRDSLKATETKAGEIQSDVEKLSTERAKLNERMLETSALVQKSEAQMTAIEGRLDELSAQEKLLRGSLGQQHGRIAKLLSALQRMGRNPPPVMITRREDALAMVRSAMLLSSAFPEMRSEALDLTGKLNELVRVMTDIRTEGDRLKSETVQLTDMRTRLAGLMETKKRSIGERQMELSQVKQAATEIEKSVSDLNDLITKLDEAVRKNTGLGAYDQETKQGETQVALAVPGPGNVPGVGGSPAVVDSPPVAVDPVLKPTEPPPGLGDTKPDTQVVELAPGAGSSLVPGNAGRIKPLIAFSAARGRLPLPAQGRKVLTYGDKTQFGGSSKGIVIETRPSALVTAPCDGWIVYAGEFRSYGQLLIINAGGGYHILVAGLSQIDVQPGQFVLAAEAIGTMSAQPKSSQAQPDQAAPVLYIEFRKDGQPIDPDPWWVAGQQKVQG
jgi:murein hydrolase activator